MELRWLVGHYVEKILDEAFKKSGILTSTNRVVTGEIEVDGCKEDLSGELDQTIVLNLKTLKKFKVDMSGFSPEFIKELKEGLEYVVDIKTAGMTAWWSIPKDSNILQLNLYMDKTGIKHGFLLYINPDTGKYSIFYVPYSKDMAESAYNKFKYILKHTCKKELPEREAGEKGKDHFPCSYVSKTGKGCCNYFTKCWGEPPSYEKEKNDTIK
jgi:hypothetical protein